MAEGPAVGAELCWEDWLPVGWRLSPVVSGAELSHLYDAALTRLNAVLTVGEALAAESPDEAPPRAQDILRLEARLNLLLAMVGELLAAQRPRPPARAVRLGGGWVEWRDPQPPAVGDALAIDLYLNPSIPDAVTLPARVESVGELRQGQAVVHATFLEIPPSVLNAMEKLVFRWHRRRVAEQRRASPPKF